MQLNSKIILAEGIKLDKNYVNVLSFSESEMVDLVTNKRVYMNNNYSFLRPQNSIWVKCPYETALKANYMAFQNPDYSNKWFFAFIDEVIYKSDNAVEITYTVDAWSTWFSYWDKKSCYVVRHHVNDDEIGNYLQDENLNIGEVVADFEETMNVIGAESFYWFVIASNYEPSTKKRFSGVGSYANYPQGSLWFAWLVNLENPDDTIAEINTWLDSVDEAARASDIQTMFALPYQAFSLNDIDSETHLVKLGGGQQLNQDFSYTKSTLRQFNDYMPKNNKLYTYPYSFLRITNNLGSYNDYRFEDFETVDVSGKPSDEVIFNAVGVPCQGYSGKLRPKYYKGLKFNEDESLSIGKYPILSWSSDSFTNWVTQNSVNMITGGTNTLINSLGNFMKGNVAQRFI